jgi:hypothetical protein
MADIREVIGSPFDQGEKEEIAYSIDFTPQGADPVGPVFDLYDLASSTDVSATCLVGLASVVGSCAVSPIVKGLKSGVAYRLTCLVTVGGQKIAPYMIIQGHY